MMGLHRFRSSVRPNRAVTWPIQNGEQKPAFRLKKESNVAQMIVRMARPASRRTVAVLNQIDLTAARFRIIGLGAGKSTPVCCINFTRASVVTDGRGARQTEKAARGLGRRWAIFRCSTQTAPQNSSASPGDQEPASRCEGELRRRSVAPSEPAGGQQRVAIARALHQPASDDKRRPLFDLTPIRAAREDQQVIPLVVSITQEMQVIEEIPAREPRADSVPHSRGRPAGRCN